MAGCRAARFVVDRGADGVIACSPAPVAEVGNADAPATVRLYITGVGCAVKGDGDRLPGFGGAGAADGERLPASVALRMSYRWRWC